MIPHNRFCATIITIHQGLRVLELSRHRLALDSAVQVSERVLHVRDGLAAYRATIRALRIFRKAFVVNAMPTTHHDHGFGRREHIVPANRTVALGGALDTAMGTFNRDGQADAACLALV